MVMVMVMADLAPAGQPAPGKTPSDRLVSLPPIGHITMSRRTILMTRIMMNMRMKKGNMKMMRLTIFTKE